MGLEVMTLSISVSPCVVCVGVETGDGRVEVKAVVAAITWSGTDVVITKGGAVRSDGVKAAVAVAITGGEAVEVTGDGGVVNLMAVFGGQLELLP